MKGEGGKDFEKRKVLRPECKTRQQKCQPKHDDGEELGDDEGSN